MAACLKRPDRATLPCIIYRRPISCQRAHAGVHLQDWWHGTTVGKAKGGFKLKMAAAHEQKNVWEEIIACGGDVSVSCDRGALWVTDACRLMVNRSALRTEINPMGFAASLLQEVIGIPTTDFLASSSINRIVGALRSQQLCQVHEAIVRIKDACQTEQCA